MGHIGAGSTSYSYDPLGRLTGTTRGGRSVGYGYDAAGRLTGVDYPANLGSVALAYDAKGRLASISDWDSRVTTFGYDALDRLTSLSRPGDLQSVFAHDPLGRVTAIEPAIHPATIRCASNSTPPTIEPPAPGPQRIGR